MSKVAPATWFMVGLLAASWIVLQPGVLEYDERRTFLYVTNLVQAGFRWQDFLALKGPGEGLYDMSHDFAWFLLQMVLYLPYAMLGSAVAALNSSFAREFYMSAWMNLAVWLCCFVAWKILRQRGLTPATAGLTLGAFFAGTYIVSAVPTGYLANIEALLICTQILLLEANTTRSPRSIFLTGLCGGYLMALRLYAFPAVLALLLLHLRSHKADRRPHLAAWAAGAAMALAIAFFPRYFLPIPGRPYTAEMVPFVTSPLFLPAYFSRAAQALFSFGYGIPLTAPFLLFAFFAPDRTALYVKLAAFLAVLALTILFPFWPGEYGIAGNRYMLAYIFLLLPETGTGFQYIIGRHPPAILLAPILVATFIPCMEFRPNVTTLHAAGNYLSGPNQAVPIEGRVVAGDPAQINRRMPVWNPLFHPAVFGWWQTTALLTGKRMILPLGASVAMDPKMVPLYGLAPRIAYIQGLAPNEITDPRIASIRQTLLKRPAWQRGAIPLLAVLVVCAWLGLLMWATRTAWQEAAGTGPRGI